MCAPEGAKTKKGGGKEQSPGTGATAGTSTPPSPRPASPSSSIHHSSQEKKNIISSSFPPLLPASSYPSHHEQQHQRVLRRQSSSTLSEAAKHGFHLTIGSVFAALTVLFSLYFPFALAPWAASETYHNAFFEYDADLNHFDNSIWTYGSDYLLTLCMFLLARNINYKVYSASHSSDFGKEYIMVGRAHHKWWSRGLLSSYMLSVLAGGLAHQFYTTLESRNSVSFRILWTCCVGTVTAASGFMGAIGAELVRQDAVIRSQQAPGKRAKQGRRWDLVMPNLPEVFWIGFGILATGVVIGGGFSFQRPACDIFIAGITQFPSTFYLMFIFTCGLTSMPTVKPWARIVGVLGFILNAPLLPLYPLLVQYTDWSLASVNTLLHSWLLLAWSLQGIALRHVGQALQVAAEDLIKQHEADAPGGGGSPSSQQQQSSLALSAKMEKPKVS